MSRDSGTATFQTPCKATPYKAAYTDLVEACIDAIVATISSGETVHLYRCPQCRAVHLTRVPTGTDREGL